MTSANEIVYKVTQQISRASELNQPHKVRTASSTHTHILRGSETQSSRPGSRNDYFCPSAHKCARHPFLLHTMMLYSPLSLPLINFALFYGRLLLSRLLSSAVAVIADGSITLIFEKNCSVPSQKNSCSICDDVEKRGIHKGATVYTRALFNNESGSLTIKLEVSSQRWNLSGKHSRSQAAIAAEHATQFKRYTNRSCCSSFVYSDSMKSPAKWVTRVNSRFRYSKTQSFTSGWWLFHKIRVPVPRSCCRQENGSNCDHVN